MMTPGSVTLTEVLDQNCIAIEQFYFMAWPGN